MGQTVEARKTNGAATNGAAGNGSADATIAARLKQIIVESLNLEGTDPAAIGDDEPLFGEGLGLDSVDALELVVALEKEYGIKIRSNEIDPQAFASVTSLARFVAGRREAAGHPPGPAAGDAAG